MDGITQVILIFFVVYVVGPILICIFTFTTSQREKDYYKYRYPHEKDKIRHYSQAEIAQGIAETRYEQELKKKEKLEYEERVRRIWGGN